jgi:hypothetical protein
MTFLELLPWLWLSAIFLGIALMELLWSGVVVLRAADVGYDAVRCEDRKPRIDLKKARTRAVTWLRLGLPLFMVAAGLFAIQAWSMSVLTYTLISIAWFLSTPLRMLWGLAMYRRVAIRRGEVYGYWAHVRHYYAVGLRMPQRPPDQVWFVDRLKWLNSFQNLWFIVQVYRFWGILWQAAASLLWPLASLFAIFFHLNGPISRDYTRPWWRFDRKSS